jgi:hypothetical protein
MKIINSIGLFSLLIANTVNAQPSFTKQSLIGGKVEISLPATYAEVAGSEIDKDYLDPNYKPTVVYREGKEGSSFKIVLEKNQVSTTEVGQYKSWRVSRMLKDSTLNVIAHDLKDINNRKIGIIKVNYPQIQRYHHYFFTSLEGQLILLILECASPEISNKNQEFDKIMNSLLIR